MGCLLTCFRNPNGQVPLEETAEEPKVYSWDKRDRSNLQDFVIDGKKGETIVRHPGSVNGEQIVIQNCQDCSIFIFDHIATVSVDDCLNCRLFIGPVKSSFFIRDCKECKMVVACQQFRTRDCFQIDTFLLCGTQPIIESSTRMRFACFRYYYKQLEDQFKSAGLSVYNNNWSNLHDFTPVPGEGDNFTLLPQDAKVEDYVPLPEGEEFDSMQIQLEEGSSIVPQSWGTRRKQSDESCLIVFFSDGGSAERAANFIQAMHVQHPECGLIQTKDISMNPDDSKRVFGTDSYTNAVQQGPVIGLEINGNQSVHHCQTVIMDLMKGTTGLVFVSQSAESAGEQIENFYNFADIQMGV